VSRWLLLLACLLAAPAARAEVSEITFVRQYGVAYTPLLIMEADRLIEKHAEALGLAGFKVNWAFLTSGAAANDGLLSGRLAFGIGAPPAMLLLWDKTRGTPNAIKGVIGVAVMPTVLNTRDPKITSIRDFTDHDRIAVPAVKLSNHAIALQMAAARAFGAENYARLDTLTVAVPHPDAAAQLMGRAAGEITSHFTSPPFDVFELKSPSVHTVLNSFDVMGDTSLTLVWTTERFAAANPMVVQAVYDAVQEAVATINRDKAAAADRYLALSGDKIARADLMAVFDNPRIQFNAAPQGVMTFASFMKQVGTLRAAPKDWKDLFFPAAQTLPGS
jgi:NitT/TauT family transport system substrate-binding protein